MAKKYSHDVVENWQQSFMQQFPKCNVVKLACSDYGFECSFFVTKENEIDDVIKEFGEYTEKEHELNIKKKCYSCLFYENKESNQILRI